MLATLVGGSLAAGGANAINMYVDRDIDAIMHRTAKRPLVTGVIDPRGPRSIFAVALEVAAFVELWLAVNLLSAVLAVSRHPLLRLRLHALAEADLEAEHRHRRCRRGHARPGRVGGGAGTLEPGAARAVRRDLRVDPAPLLGAGHQVQGGLRRGRRADAAVGGVHDDHGPPDPRLHGRPVGHLAGLRCRRRHGRPLLGRRRGARRRLPASTPCGSTSTRPRPRRCACSRTPSPTSPCCSGPWRSTNWCAMSELRVGAPGMCRVPPLDCLTRRDQTISNLTRRNPTSFP